MDSKSKKITSLPGFSKAILVVREKIVCFKEGKKLLSDDGLHSFRDELSDCNGTIVEWIRLVAFFWDRKDVGLFPRGGKCAKSVGKLE